MLSFVSSNGSIIVRMQCMQDWHVGQLCFPMTSTKRLNVTRSCLLNLKEWDPSEFFLKEGLHTFHC